MEALDDCPDDSDDESMAIAQLLLRQQCYRINDGAFAAFADSIRCRRMFSLFANAGSIRHGIDRMRSSRPTVCSPPQLFVFCLFTNRTVCLFFLFNS